MKNEFKFSVFLSLVILNILFVGCKKTSADKPTVVVSNTYLAAAVSDLCGDKVNLICLAPPGSCPGHFDLRPMHAQQIRQSRLILAFDFQTPIGQISTASQTVTKPIIAPQGLCIPATYLHIVKQVADALVTIFPGRAKEIAARIDKIAHRLSALETDCRRTIESSGLTNAPALVWAHQAAFVSWLGLDVVATVAGNEMSVAQTAELLETARQKKVRLVIANQQQNRQLAEKFAAIFDAKVAVFSNFPDFGWEPSDIPAFDAMVRHNVSQLTATQ